MLKEKVIENKLEYLQIIMLVFVGLFLCIAPLKSGLFFFKDVLIATNVGSLSIFIFGLIRIIFVGNKSNKKRVVDVIFIFYTLLVLSYVVTIITGVAVSFEGTIREIIKNSFLLIFYSTLKMTICSDKNKEMLMKWIVISGMIVSLIAIFAVSGVVEIKDAFLDTRYTATFQYANAFAIFLIAPIMLSGYILSEKTKYTMQFEQYTLKDGLLRAFYSSAQFFFILLLIFTYSRGTWLILPFTLLGLILALPKEVRIIEGFGLIANFVVVALLSKPFYMANLSEGPIKVKTLIIALLGCIIAGIFSLAFYFISSKIKPQKVNVSKGVAAIVICVIIMSSFFIVTIDQALISDNLSESGRGNVGINRFVTKIEPEKSYELEFNYEKLKDTVNQGYMLSISSIDAQGNVQNLELNKIENVNQNQEKNISVIEKYGFETNDNTEKIRINLSVGESANVVSISNFKVLNSDGTIFKKVKLSYRFIPEFIIGRINSINLNEKVSVGSRLTTYKDAYRVFKESPIIGRGGFAWDALYSAYQTELYYTSVVHNYLAQLAVELGSVGLFGLIVLVVALFWEWFKAYKEKNTRQQVLIISSGAILAHSFIDFDFAFLSIQLLFVSTLALVDYGFEDKYGHLEKINKLNSKIILTLVAALLFFGTLSLIIANKNYEGANALLSSGEQDGAVDLYEKSLRFNPFSTDTRIDLVNLFNQIASNTGDYDYVLKSEELIKEGLKYSYNDPSLMNSLIDKDIIKGDFVNASSIALKILESAPLRQDVYDVQLKAMLTIGNYYISQNDYESASKYYGEIINAIAFRSDYNLGTTIPEKFDNDYMQTANRMSYFGDNYKNQLSLSRLNKLIDSCYLNFDVDHDNVPDEFTTIEASKNDGINLESGVLILSEASLGLKRVLPLQPDKIYRIEVKLGNLSGYDLEDLKDNIYIQSASKTEDQIEIISQSFEDHYAVIEFKTYTNLLENKHQIVIRPLKEKALEVKSYELFEISEEN